MSNLLTMDDSHTTRGHDYKLKKVRCNTSLRQNFFSYRIVDTWNNLHDTVVDAPSLQAFKNRLDAKWKSIKYSV